MAWINKEEALKIFEGAHTLDYNANAYRAQIEAIPEETWMDDFQLVAVPTIPGPGKIYTNGACVVMSHQDFENIQKDRWEQRCRVREAREEAREIKDAFRTVRELLR